jgi:hypothetical protein
MSEFKILQIMPSPPGMMAIFKDGFSEKEGEYLKIPLVALVLVQDTQIDEIYITGATSVSDCIDLCCEDQDFYGYNTDKLYG